MKMKMMMKILMLQRFEIVKNFNKIFFYIFQYALDSDDDEQDDKNGHQASPSSSNKKLSNSQERQNSYADEFLFYYQI